MTKIAVGTFLATPTEVCGPAIGKRATQEGEKPLAGGYLLLLPYWYSISENRVLKCVGESALAWSDLCGEGKRQATAEQIADDASSVTGVEFEMTNWEVYKATLQGTHTSQVKASVLSRPGNGMPNEGDYVGLMGSLYTVGHVGKLKFVGNLQSGPADFVKDFARLTGLVAVDINSLESPSTPEQMDAMFNRMPKAEQERFLRECARMFGPPPALRTHD